MAPGQRTDDRYRTDSPTAWRVRTRVLDRQGLPAHVDSATLERSRVGIARIFTAAFNAAVRAQQAERVAEGLRLKVEHRELGRGNVGLWFDALDQLLLRPIPGPGGPRSRIEISVPGVAPSRMYSDLWEWIHSQDGGLARRGLVATIAAPGVEEMKIIFYEGQESEHVLRLSSSQRLRDFAAGR